MGVRAVAGSGGDVPPARHAVEEVEAVGLDRDVEGCSDCSGAVGKLVCRPYSVDELHRMRPDDLRTVEGFSVSVEGMGSLSWPGLTDVSAIVHSLEKVIIFRPHEVRVYTDGVPKPPLGEGLNKRCVYTMGGVWVRDRITGRYLSDPKSIEAFRAQLLRKADRMGARMLGYDHQRGQWKIELTGF